jgi:acetyl-CoA synthetase
LAKSFPGQSALRRPPDRTASLPAARKPAPAADKPASRQTVPNQDIDSTLRENRVFPPPPEFSAKAHIKSLEEYEALYKQSIADPEAFWAGAAKELHWFKPWDKVLEWNLPWAKWFVGGKLNLSYNCVDRHSSAPARQDRLIWEGEPGEVRRLTYAELHAEVQRSPTPSRPRHRRATASPSTWA